MTLPTPLEMSVLGTGLLVGAGLVFWFLHSVRIALYMGGAGLFLLACAGVAYDYEKMGEAKVQPQIDQAKLAQAKAEAERDHAKADTDACVATAKAQSDLVDIWRNKAESNASAAKAAKAQADRQAAAAAPKIAELQAAAAAKPQLMTCQAELDKTKQVLRDALAARRQPVKELPK